MGIVTLNALWEANAPLTATGLLMLPFLVLALGGLIFDKRVITGKAAWLKPAKFAASIAIYSFTLAWIVSFLPEWPLLRLIVGWTTAVTMVAEIVIISLQAARGTTSHYNTKTPLDAMLWFTMGGSIALATIALTAILVALFLHPFADPVMGWALRFGVLITVIGAATGSSMAGKGAHTVGAPDGGPGLPGTGWSTEHGDLRVPHFIGLHAMQILPFLAFVWRPSHVAAIIAAAAAYGLLFLLLLVQALGGKSSARNFARDSGRGPL